MYVKIIDLISKAVLHAGHLDRVPNQGEVVMWATTPVEAFRVVSVGSVIDREQQGPQGALWMVTVQKE